jgi:hypothetical protein
LKKETRIKNTDYEYCTFDGFKEELKVQGFEMMSIDKGEEAMSFFYISSGYKNSSKHSVNCLIHLKSKCDNE